MACPASHLADALPLELPDPPWQVDILPAVQPELAHPVVTKAVHAVFGTHHRVVRPTRDPHDLGNAVDPPWRQHVVLLDSGLAPCLIATTSRPGPPLIPPEPPVPPAPIVPASSTPLQLPLGEDPLDGELHPLVVRGLQRRQGLSLLNSHLPQRRQLALIHHRDVGRPLPLQRRRNAAEPCRVGLLERTLATVLPLLALQQQTQLPVLGPAPRQNHPLPRQRDGVAAPARQGHHRCRPQRPDHLRLLPVAGVPESQLARGVAPPGEDGPLESEARRVVVAAHDGDDPDAPQRSHRPRLPAADVRGGRRGR